MEQKFGINSIDLQLLRDYCEREGERVVCEKGERLATEGEPTPWFGFVTEGCFKYVTQGISDIREHITWFSFAGEYAGDYPACLDGSPSMTTIEAMAPSQVLRVSGAQLIRFFRQSIEAITCSVRPVPATSTSTAPRRASATSC